MPGLLWLLWIQSAVPGWPPPRQKIRAMITEMTPTTAAIQSGTRKIARRRFRCSVTAETTALMGGVLSRG